MQLKHGSGTQITGRATELAPPKVTHTSVVKAESFKLEGNISESTVTFHSGEKGTVEVTDSGIVVVPVSDPPSYYHGFKMRNATETQCKAAVAMAKAQWSTPRNPLK
jgi:hypothetical protein